MMRKELQCQDSRPGAKGPGRSPQCPTRLSGGRGPQRVRTAGRSSQAVVARVRSRSRPVTSWLSRTWKQLWGARDDCRASPLSVESVIAAIFIWGPCRDPEVGARGLGSNCVEEGWGAGRGRWGQGAQDTIPSTLSPVWGAAGGMFALSSGSAPGLCPHCIPKASCHE